jgi:subtilisin family serine protease
VRAAAPLKFLTVAALGLLAGCALQQHALRAPELPAQARLNPGRFVVITVRNEPEPALVTPGSTPRGYGAAGVYGVNARARAITHSLEHDYRLLQVSAWPIESLRVNCIVMRVPAMTARATLIARLARDSRVESVEPLNEFTTQAGSPSATGPGTPPSASGTRPYQSLQRNLKELEILQAHRLSEGAAVRIAVIDTGVDYRHPDLQGRIIARRDFVDGDGGDFTADRHGTEVAGIIAATAGSGFGLMGVAPKARLIALKACWPLPGDAAQAACNSFTLAQALQAAITAHVDVVNLSLAGPPDPLLERLVRYGMRQGIIYVGAVPPARDGLSDAFPVAVPGVLAVQSAEDARADSRHLLAPGHGILTLVPGGHYDFASGSSLATAEVTGIVALLLADGRQLPAARVERILAHSSRQLMTPAGVVTSINACAAIADALGRADCRGPVDADSTRAEDSVELSRETARRASL